MHECSDRNYACPKNCPQVPCTCKHFCSHLVVWFLHKNDAMLTIRCGATVFLHLVMFSWLLATNSLCQIYTLDGQHHTIDSARRNRPFTSFGLFNPTQCSRNWETSSNAAMPCLLTSYSMNSEVYVLFHCFRTVANHHDHRTSTRSIR
jgi:hypothetical protein